MRRGRPPKKRRMEESFVLSKIDEMDDQQVQLVRHAPGSSTGFILVKNAAHTLPSKVKVDTLETGFSENKAVRVQWTMQENEDEVRDAQLLLPLNIPAAKALESDLADKKELLDRFMIALDTVEQPLNLDKFWLGFFFTDDVLEQYSTNGYGGKRKTKESQIFEIILDKFSLSQMDLVRDYVLYHKRKSRKKERTAELAAKHAKRLHNIERRM